MGNRLSKIVTRTGDGGSTGLGDGTRVAKTAPRIEAIGDVDELNCTLGVLRACGTLPAVMAQDLLEIQHDLFDLGGELSIPGTALVTDERSLWLEQRIAAANATLPPLKEFILPGGGAAAAACHVARATCRRAERHCWALVRTPQSAVAGDPAQPQPPQPPPAADAPQPPPTQSLRSPATADATQPQPPAGVSASALRYLNRLSDLLFVYARVLARAEGGTELLWRRRPQPAT